MPKACWLARRVDGRALTGWDEVYAGGVGFFSRFGVSFDSKSRHVFLESVAGNAFDGVGSTLILVWPDSGLSSGLLSISTGIKPSSNSSGEAKACACSASSNSASSSSFRRLLGRDRLL